MVKNFAEAHFYSLHLVVHDLPDQQAIQNLRYLASAIYPDCGKILLHETVISARDPHPQATASDLAMMIASSAHERTETTWEDVIARAGLKNAKIWRVSGAIEGVVEVELP